MSKMALGGLLGDPPSGKEGRRDAKIGSIRKGSLALEKGRFKCTGQCSTLQGAIISTKGMRSLSKGTRNLNIFVLVRDLELQARGRRQRRDHEE